MAENRHAYTWMELDMEPREISVWRRHDRVRPAGGCGDALQQGLRAELGGLEIDG
jgi:hypothetical protein